MTFHMEQSVLLCTDTIMIGENMQISDIIKDEYGQNDQIMTGDLDKVAAGVVKCLLENRQTVATGESLTGGLLSERIHQCQAHHRSLSWEYAPTLIG